MPSIVGPRRTSTPKEGTSAKRMVLLGAAVIASARSRPTLPCATSNAAENSMSATIAAETHMHQARDGRILGRVAIEGDALHQGAGTVAHTAIATLTFRQPCRHRPRIYKAERDAPLWVPMVSTAAILARHRRGELSASMALAAMLVAERDLTALRLALDGAGRAIFACSISTPPALPRRSLSCASTIREPCGKGSSSPETSSTRPVPEPRRQRGSLLPGRRSFLAAATDEVVGLLDRLGILGQDRHLLDIGCGSAASSRRSPRWRASSPGSTSRPA